MKQGMGVASGSLYVESYGFGEPTLLLMHGFAGSARNFRPQSRALGSRRRVVSFDARGHARSKVPADASAYTVASFVSDAATVIDDLGVEGVVLGGTSMGAAIALQYAFERPERLRGLVIVSFPSASSKEWALAFAEAIERDGLDRAGEVFVWGGSHFDVASRNWIRQGFLEHRAEALAWTLRGVLARLPTLEASRDALVRLRIPTLVVAGDRDDRSIGVSHELVRQISGSRLAVIHDAGHVVNLEKPQLFNSVLSNFLCSIEK